MFGTAVIRDTSVGKLETDPGNSAASRFGGVRHMGVLVSRLRDLCRDRLLKAKLEAEKQA